MFVGHLAVALAAKRAAPKVSLGWLVASVMALDLLWPLFLFAGIEQVRIVPGATAFNPLIFDSYPWSHSLAMALLWGLLLAGLARIFRLPAQTGPLLVGLVVSHWVLDALTHAPDMPLWPGDSPRLGFGLWNSIPGTFVVEGALWLAGIGLYFHGRQATDRAGPIALWSLIVLTTVMWALGPWSPPPPDAGALAWFALLSWVILPWAAFADRHYALHEALPARGSTPV